MPYREHFQQVGAGKPVTGVTKVVTASGGHRYWPYRNFRSHTTSGEPLVICSAQDVTDKEIAAKLFTQS
jgi:hypothetical protein